MPLVFNPKDTRIQRIIEKCASLHETYKPPWWCFGPWMNTLIMIVKEKFGPSIRMKRETIICHDGGEVSLDWADDEVTRNLSQHAPVLGILHTITGGSSQSQGFMRYAARRGWRSCVLNRRGHSGMPLRIIPHFSIMGNVDDTVLMVDTMKQRFPSNFIGLAGISAGSGQVVSYIGREGNKAKINAATSLCPAFGLKSAFDNLRRKHSWLDRYITQCIQNHFLKPARNQPALATMPEVLKKAWTAKTLVEWMDFSAPLAGCKDVEHFYAENNPMNYVLGNKTPCLVLNALDDFLCVKENIRYDLKDKQENYVLSVTDHGSHIAYNEGMFAQGNYMWRVTLDFFETVLSENTQ